MPNDYVELILRHINPEEDIEGPFIMAPKKNEEPNVKKELLFDMSFNPDVGQVRLEEDLPPLIMLQQLRRKYVGTYCRVKGVVQYVSDFVYSKNKFFVSAGNHYPWEEAQLTPLWMEGMYNFKDRVILFERIPNRMWYRSFHSENTALVEPLWPILSAAEKELGYMHFERFRPQHLNYISPPVNYREALAGVKEDKIGRAFDKNFFISKSWDNRKDYVLWKKTFPIGRIKEDGTIVDVLPSFKEEVRDLMKGTNHAVE